MKRLAGVIAAALVACGGSESGSTASVQWHADEAGALRCEGADVKYQLPNGDLNCTWECADYGGRDAWVSLDFRQEGGGWVVIGEGVMSCEAGAAMQPWPPTKLPLLPVP